MRFECKICKKTFTRMGSLDTHKKIIHGGQSRSYKCDRCDQNFAYSQGLWRHKQRNHLRIHEVKQEKPDEDLLEEKETPKTINACKMCGLSFASYKILQMHEIMVHQDQ